MITTNQATVERPVAAREPSGPRARRGMGLKLGKTTAESRQQAAAVLDVLAGVRTPADAAKALSLSLPAYYKLESRALESLVQGCQPPGRGPKPSPEVEAHRLRRQCHRLQQVTHDGRSKRIHPATASQQPAFGQEADFIGMRQQDLLRYQALARAAQRAAGLAAAAPPKPPVKGRRVRKPAVRALKAAQFIRGVQDPPVPPPPQPVEATGPA